MAQLTDEQLHSIYDEENISNLFFTWQIGNKGSKADFTRKYINEHYVHVNSSTKVLALMQLTGENWLSADELYCDADYLVFTKEQADEAAEESAIEVVEDIMADINNSYHQYFNRAKWVEDYLNNTTNAELLSSYDGIEHTEDVGNITYYIYRCN